MTPEEFEAGWRRWHGQGMLQGGGLSLTREETWTCFHALPDSKAYVDTPSEMAIYQERAEALLAWLFPNQEAVGFAVSIPDDALGCPDWIRFVPIRLGRWLPIRTDLIYEKRRQHKWEKQGLEPGFVWSENRAHNIIDEYEILMRAYIGANPSPKDRQTIYEDVAEEREYSIVWHAPETGATFMPYTGGFDVFLETADQRDAVREQFSDWLPVPGEGYPSHLDVMEEREGL